MIIESSAVKMRSQRSFSTLNQSFNGLSALGGGIRSGMFLQTAVSTAQNARNKNSGSGKKQNNFSNSMDSLMARFNQSRSIRATSLENSRSIRSLNKIRTNSIGYLLRQMFWRTGPAADPLSALLTDYTNRIGSNLLSSAGQLRYGYAYGEAELTDFSAEGRVVTASGREISFNVEMTMSRSFYEEVSTVVDFGSLNLTDPLVINLDTEPASVSDQKFYFDLDADGHAEQISRLNAGSGFLALDKNGDGIINDGSELFGTKSGNGFADLAKYDQDGNGWIDEADEIFDKLLIWQKDENGNDILRGLGAAGVGAIYLGNVNTQFSLNSETDNKTNAVVRQTGMFLYENGETGTVQQIDLAN